MSNSIMLNTTPATPGRKVGVRRVTADWADAPLRRLPFRQACRLTISVTCATQAVVNLQVDAKSRRVVFVMTRRHFLAPEQTPARFVLPLVTLSMDRGNGSAASTVII